MLTLDVVPLRRVAAQEVVFERLRKAAGLGSVSANDALAAFQDAADDDLNLTRDAFHEVLRTRFLPKGQSNLEYEQSRLLLNRVFDAFDHNGDGIVDFTELAAGVAALCSGTPTDQVEAAFALYDVDSDGFIEKPEMEKLLRAVYKVMFQARPSYAKAIGTSATELAALTTRHCFAEADTNHDGKLSLEEFKKWYSTSGGDALKASVVKNVADLPPAVSIAEVKDLTGLSKVPVTDVWPAFQEASNEDGALSRDDFGEVFRTQFLPHQSPLQCVPAHPAHARAQAATVVRVAARRSRVRCVSLSRAVAAGTSAACSSSTACLTPSTSTRTAWWTASSSPPA